MPIVLPNGAVSGTSKVDISTIVGYKIKVM
jgi:hypothetical protein